MLPLRGTPHRRCARSWRDRCFPPPRPLCRPRQQQIVSNDGIQVRARQAMRRLLSLRPNAMARFGVCPAAMGSVLPQNRKNSSGRLELKKYNKYLRRMTVHREIK